MDVLEIGDVIAHIDLGTLVVRTQPYDIDPKIPNVVEFRDDARDVPGRRRILSTTVFRVLV